MPQFSRRRFITIASVELATQFSGLAFGSAAQPIRIVVGYPPGGMVDSFARLLAVHGGKVLDQQIIVDNKPGAGTIIAAENVAKSMADGRTLFLTLSGSLINNTALYQKLPYDPNRDFTYIALLATVPIVTTVHKSVPAANLQELVAYSRSRKDLSFGSWAPGSAGHIVCEALNKSYQLSLVHVPYKGEAPMIQDLVGGQIQIASGSVGSMQPHLRSGAVKAIALTGSHRSQAAPEVMTFAEQGGSSPAFAAVGWMGLVGPANLPAETVARWKKIVLDFLNLPDVQQRLNTYGADPKFLPAEEFYRFWQADLPVWTKLINDTGVKLD